MQQVGCQNLQMAVGREGAGSRAQCAAWGSLG